MLGRHKGLRRWIVRFVRLADKPGLEIDRRLASEPLATHALLKTRYSLFFMHE